MFTPGTLEQKLTEFVSTEPVDWKFYVQVFTWSVCLFESYLLYVPSPATPRPLDTQNPLTSVLKFPTIPAILEDGAS